MANPASALLVNDDPMQLRIAAEILAQEGFETVSCRGAEEALERLAERGKVDLIVTDLYMPGIDGWRFCRLLRSSAYAAFNNIPILVASATFSGSEADEVTAQLGADGFLPAPYEPEALQRMARDLVGNAKPVKLTHVLIVEPEPASRQSLQAVFQANGYAVTCAATGDEARSRLRGAAAQIVILDYDTAALQPEALIAAVKQPASSTVVIVMTADRSADLALALIRRGVDSYVHKPVAPEFILHLCETAGRQRALLRVEELLEQRTRRLRNSEDRYRTLFENAGDGVVVYSLDGIVIGMNRELEALSGTSRDDLTGQSYGKLLTPAGFSKAAEQQTQALGRQELSWMFEAEIVRGDGAPVPVEMRCRLLGDGLAEDGQASVIMAMFRDLTAQQKLQTQRAEFTAMLAHDIRNPIGLILGCAELLLDTSGPPLDPATAHKCYQRIRDDARLLESLVSNYLDESRIAAAQLKLSRRRMDLRPALERIVERYQCEAQPRSIRLELMAGDAAPVQGDGLALDRVFANLLHNACKFTPAGGAIRVAMARLNSEVLVEVRDDGPGIEPAKLATLFQKFSRIETGERREGVGLGLYIANQLVLAHGGRVEVQSAPGQGSCFSVFLPLADVARQAGEEE